MDKNRKIELIQRSLGLRHKLKVHDTMKQPDTHEELALMMISKWELEDELNAIELILTEDRHDGVKEKKKLILNKQMSFAKKLKDEEEYEAKKATPKSKKK